MRISSLIYSPAQHRQQQHWQGWNQFGMTGVFVSVPRYDWCALLSYHLPVCLWIMDPHSRTPKKNTSHGNEVLPQDTTHLIQRPCYQRGNPCRDPAGNTSTRSPPDDRKEMQIAVVWSCFTHLYIFLGLFRDWPKPSCKAQWKGEEDKADRSWGWETTSGNRQAWSSASSRAVSYTHLTLPTNYLV